MSFLKKLLKKNEDPIKNYIDFWTWFHANQKAFHDIVKSGKNPENGFFNKLSARLAELTDGIFYLTGMHDENTAELIFTADGAIKNIVFVEELVEAAPPVPNWKFTALKPAIEDVQIQMDGCTFDSDALSFYSVDNENYPDEIDLVLVHNNYDPKKQSTLSNGTLIFLDNFLGELTSVTTIDNARVIGKDQAEQDLIPIAKLKSYLTWREREFVEKYAGSRHASEDDRYASLEAELENGMPVIAIVNATLLEWDNKVSHPWMLDIEINFESKQDNGLPDEATYQLLERFEHEVLTELRDTDGYLNIGRQTANGCRDILFACKDFRKPSKVVHELAKQYANELSVTYEIYKDKYWQSFERFRPDR